MEVRERQYPITNSSIPTQTPTTCVDIIATDRKAPSWLSTLTRFHAGYFRISLSLCGQALLWKILREPSTDAHALRPVIHIIPSATFFVLWSLALLSLVALCLLFIIRCLFRIKNIKAEISHHVGMNYLFAPWISWLLLLESTPFLQPKNTSYLVLWWVFSVPIVALDVKIYGQWFTGGKNLLSMAANPTSQISVIGNLVGARAAARMGWRESAMCMFSLGLVHYLVLFVTLYQRFVGNDSLPAMLRPVFFLFFAAPSMASLAWQSISGTFDIASKMLLFLSLFLFASLILFHSSINNTCSTVLSGQLMAGLKILFHSSINNTCSTVLSGQLMAGLKVSRPALFRRSMRRFNVAWWAYSFPLTVLAMAATEYAQEEKGIVSNALMLVLSLLSALVTLVLVAFTFLKAGDLVPRDEPFAPSPSVRAGCF